jgi:acyl dehydratase
LRFLHDLALGERFACGSFTLSRAEIIDFAGRYDPQPFHLDDAAAAVSYFGSLCASGLHTQAAAIGLLVPVIADVSVVAGYRLHEARFFIPVRPELTYDVAAVWTAITPAPLHPERGRADITVDVTNAETRQVATVGVTYVVRERPGRSRNERPVAPWGG